MKVLKNKLHFFFYIHHQTGWPLVREKSGKFDFSSRSGKSQRILQTGQGNFKYQESQGISKFWPIICIVASTLTT